MGLEFSIPGLKLVGSASGRRLDIVRSVVLAARFGPNLVALCLAFCTLCRSRWITISCGFLKLEAFLGNSRRF
ncbi:hypothetical protein CPB83DRAFT_862650 [Crepidotus variabilis]|uniref:Uncharacterized protein n=1 Tax=Crepidotus variabilis TaxID=179855 RepID=A0A9P6E6P5_9AGAR|nr:hypothetical protein CPB83DRAFT_862650 [Crepidotus variabilis]